MTAAGEMPPKRLLEGACSSVVESTSAAASLAAMAAPRGQRAYDDSCGALSAEAVPVLNVHSAASCSGVTSASSSASAHDLQKSFTGDHRLSLIAR